ncbi:MAG TPA: CARDB domain-containing protein [Thermoanaerobaculia bacterium]|nr:CARDB domain-containing protein [Thermoanaerobaculia bacterium]
MRRSLPFLSVILPATLAAPLAAQAPLPDLVVSSLTVSPPSVAPGGSLEIVSEIRNAGAAEVPSRGPAAASTAVDIRLMTGIADVHGDYLAGWGPLRAIPPGGTEHYTSHATVPASKAPGAYFVCVDVDLGHIVTESNETNNRLCKALTVTGGKSGPEFRIPGGSAGGLEGIRPGTLPPGAGLPDLTITGVSVGAVSGVSRAVQVTVKNAGAAPAANFRVDAFQLAPKRWPLLLTVCPQASHAGGSASCASVWETGSLAAGASRTYAGWVTFPADHHPGSSERVEFMADGCFPALEPALPASCRVAESNEANNTWAGTVVVP